MGLTSAFTDGIAAEPPPGSHAAAVQGPRFRAAKPGRSQPSCPNFLIVTAAWRARRGTVATVRRGSPPRGPWAARLQTGRTAIIHSIERELDPHRRPRLLGARGAGRGDPGPLSGHVGPSGPIRRRAAG